MRHFAGKFVRKGLNPILALALIKRPNLCVLVEDKTHSQINFLNIKYIKLSCLTSKKKSCHAYVRLLCAR